MVVEEVKEVVIFWHKARGVKQIAQCLPVKSLYRIARLPASHEARNYHGGTVHPSDSPMLFLLQFLLHTFQLIQVHVLNDGLAKQQHRMVHQVHQIHSMILRGSIGGLMVCGAAFRRGNDCLIRLGVSYRTRFLSLVSTQSNMGMFVYREIDEKQAIIRCCLLASDKVQGTHLLNLYVPYGEQMKSDCFIRDLESLCRLTTGLAVILLYGRFQYLIIQDLRSDTAELI